MTSVVLSTCLETTYEKIFESETSDSSYTCTYAQSSKSQKTIKWVKPSIFPLKTQLRATIYEVADYMSLSKYKICKNLWIQWTVGFCSYRETKNLKIRILKPRRWKLKFCLYNGQTTRWGTISEIALTACLSFAGLAGSLISRKASRAFGL